MRPTPAHAMLVASFALAATLPAQSERLDLAIPMRDKASLSADLYLPEGDAKHPCILIQTPYDKRRLRAVLRGRERAGRSDLGGRRFSLPIDRAHYAYLVVDWRGFYASKKAAGRARVTTKQRGRDGYDCVEWAAAQPWSDGKVGTWGGSALGRQQFVTARERPPHLVCAVPTIAPLGQTYAQYYPGGALLEGQVQTMDRLGFGVSRLVRAFPFPNSLVWKQAERTLRPQDFDLPMLLVTGWWDLHPTEVLESFDLLVTKGGTRTRAQSQLLIGPWHHTGIDVAAQGNLRFPAAVDVAKRAAKVFLDTHLRGIEPEDAPPFLRYFVVAQREGGGVWRDADAWPPPSLAYHLHLAQDGALRTAVARARSWRAFTCDPKAPVPTLGGRNLRPLPAGPRDLGALDARDDLLVYATEAFDRALLLLGAPRVEVTLRADRVDCDLVARLALVGEGGRSILLADGVQRASLQGGRRKLLEPGEPRRLSFALSPVACEVASGQALRLYLSCTNWPRYERNAHTAAAHYDAKKALPCKIEVLQGGKDASRLVLPVGPSLRPPAKKER